jgi:hypothetical protein
MELQMPSEYQVAWWNLENLVDEENAPASRRTDKVFRAIRNGIAGWTPQRRDRKVAQLASVIVQMNAGAGPDLLGVCEVENRFALDLLVDAVGALLPARDYGVVHADTDDARGIDVAFLYDRALLEVPPNETFFHVVMRRNATREIVQVNFRTRQGRTWSVFGNHWPSRSGGHLESAGYRHIAGETLSYFHRRALELIFTCCHPALGTEAQVASPCGRSAGRNVRAKAGLNRGILANAWGMLVQRLEDKAPGRVVKINPATRRRRARRAGTGRRSTARAKRCSGAGPAVSPGTPT